MNDNALQSSLEQVNSQLLATIERLEQCLQRLQSGQVDDPFHDDLAQSLQECIGKRQLLLQQLLAALPQYSHSLLETQQQLTGEFERRLSAIRQFYADALAAVRGNGRKLDLYRTLDTRR